MITLVRLQVALLTIPEHQEQIMPILYFEPEGKNFSSYQFLFFVCYLLLTFERASNKLFWLVCINRLHAQSTACSRLLGEPSRPSENFFMRL